MPVLRVLSPMAFVFIFAGGVFIFTGIFLIARYRYSADFWSRPINREARLVRWGYIAAGLALVMYLLAVLTILHR